MNSSLNSRLHSYKLAGLAVAAGSVGTSDGAVVFINYNNTLLVDQAPGDGFVNAYEFDLNGDAVEDFALWAGNEGQYPGIAIFQPARNAVNAIIPIEVMGTTFQGPNAVYEYPARLTAGAIIASSAAFVNLNTGATRGDLAWGAGYPNSVWGAGNNSNLTGYIGLRFRITGQDHYAWINITVGPNTGANPRAITLHGAAYESTPGAPIEAGVMPVPEPTGPGLLALGGAGLIAYRRRRKVA